MKYTQRREDAPGGDDRARDVLEFGTYEDAWDDPRFLYVYDESGLKGPRPQDQGTFVVALIADEFDGAAFVSMTPEVAEAAAAMLLKRAGDVRLRQQLQQLVNEAAEAVETIDADALEEFARRKADHAINHDDERRILGGRA